MINRDLKQFTDLEIEVEYLRRKGYKVADNGKFICTCKMCGKEFLSTHYQNNVCSNECWGESDD